MLGARDYQPGGATVRRSEGVEVVRHREDVQMDVDEALNSVRPLLGPALEILTQSGRQLSAVQAYAEVLEGCRTQDQ